MDNDQLQLWGGVECTVNRLGNCYRDQLIEGGHAARDEDLDLLCDLGITAVRYPVLWERVMRDAVDAPDWTRADWKWSDRRLSKLVAREVEPIIGLVHHGSGPMYTNLLDEGFISGLAQYAGLVARRYPWAQMYTPVNEPLTTARFSCLYGHWFPHSHSDDQFVTALLIQCLSIGEAMRAIRSVNPSAKLLLTEDLGKTHSTLALRGQADFENQRRWLSMDLLTGQVSRSHPLYTYLARSSQLIAWLDRLADNPCPPDVLGLNYYLTSERFLDQHYQGYPASTHGGNGRDLYADVEAVRVLEGGVDGRERLMTEVWNRYRLPMVVSEVHICGTDSEQILWLRDCWHGTQQLRAEGIDVRAVTAWSLFGSYDWNSLCTCRNGQYETGAFDVSSGIAVPTRLARYIRQLAGDADTSEYAIGTPGWWQCASRVLYPFGSHDDHEAEWQSKINLAEGRKLRTSATAQE